MAKCAYRGEKIIEIEEKWIDENVKDEKERVRRKEALHFILKILGEKADCRLNAVDGSEFCMFHDPKYWESHADEVREEFLKHLKNGESFFIGFHLPEIKFPKVVENDVYMSLAKFHGSLIAETNFEGKALFDFANFEKEASFEHAKFKERASFYEAKFGKEASFYKANFKEASFYFAKFKEGASFINTNFEKEASFIRAEFKRASFYEAKFGKEASFIGANFKEGASFYKAIFFGKATFDSSTFLGHVIFENSDFLPDLLEKCLDPQSYISFRRVSFKKKGSQIMFDGCNMRKVSFIYTDVRRVKFNNVNWGEDFRIYDEKLFLLKEEERERKAFIKECKKKLEKIRDVLEGKKKDEEIEKEIELEKLMGKTTSELKAEINEKINSLENEGEKLKELESLLRKDYDLKLDNVLAVYRSLRDNHDYYLKYEDSGRFFINEMRLKRRFIGKASSGSFWKKLSSIAEKLVMLLYEAISLYGESYTRPIGFIIACISMFSILRFLVNNWYILQTGFCWSSLQSLLEEFKNSTYTFFQLYWDEKPLTFIERLLSPLILGALYISLRRKLERKIRH